MMNFINDFLNIFVTTICASDSRFVVHRIVLFRMSLHVSKFIDKFPVFMVATLSTHTWKFPVFPQ